MVQDYAKNSDCTWLTSVTQFCTDIYIIIAEVVADELPKYVDLLSEYPKLEKYTNGKCVEHFETLMSGVSSITEEKAPSKDNLAQVVS